MVFKIKDLEYALERYTDIVGDIQDNSKRVNTNKRQAFMNAFIGQANLHNLRELFDIKDTNNIRYAFKRHNEKLLTQFDYNENFEIAKAIRLEMISKRYDEKILEKA